MGRRRLRWVLGALATGALASCAASAIAEAEVEEKAEDALEAQIGSRPEIDCPGDLDAEVGATMRCTLTAADGTTAGVTVTVTSVDGSDAQFDVVVDDAAGGATDTTAPATEDTTASSETTATTEADAATSSTEAPAEDATATGDPAAVAESVLLTTEELGVGWTEAPATESLVDYATVAGCEFMVDLVDSDGFAAEAESGDFSMGDIGVDHSVRVYPSADVATDVVLQWAEQATVDCVVAGAEQGAQAAFDSGDLAPFEGVEFDLQAYNDHVGEPRITNLELTNTLTGPEGTLVLINDRYFLQVGNIVSNVGFLSPDGLWDGRDAVLQLVVQKMNEAAGG